jgi:hypothetical protein
LLENSKHDKWKHMEVLSRGQSRLPHWLLHFCVPRVQFLNSWNLQNVCIMAYWLILTGWRNIIDSHRLSPCHHILPTTVSLPLHISLHLSTSLHISPPRHLDFRLSASCSGCLNQFEELWRTQVPSSSCHSLSCWVPVGYLKLSQIFSCLTSKVFTCRHELVQAVT